MVSAAGRRKKPNPRPRVLMKESDDGAPHTHRAQFSLGFTRVAALEIPLWF